MQIRLRKTIAEYIYKLLRVRITIRMVSFEIIRYALVICSNTFLETELWLTATSIRIPYIT